MSQNQHNENRTEDNGYGEHFFVQTMCNDKNLEFRMQCPCYQPTSDYMAQEKRECAWLGYWGEADSAFCYSKEANNAFMLKARYRRAYNPPLIVIRRPWLHFGAYRSS